MRHSHEAHEEARNDIETVLAQLAATPRRIAAASNTKDNVRLQAKPDENTWSANELLAHLRACNDVWGKSILAMIAQDHPTLRYVSPRTRMKKTDYAQQDFHRSFEVFTQQRSDLLHALTALDIEDWWRGATFTATTRGREQTVLSYAQRMAQHELEHCQQIEVLLK